MTRKEDDVSDSLHTCPHLPWHGTLMEARTPSPAMVLGYDIMRMPLGKTETNARSMGVPPQQLSVDTCIFPNISTYSSHQSAPVATTSTT
eukprot:m.367221 g.367221  ORF g.367221 m.367221 type:complete len:90 (+) comp39609_c0_seq1:32-301(+)